MTDREWNWAPELHGVTVQIAAADHVRPVSDDPHYPRTVTDPVRVTFTEDVTNLSADAVEVFEVITDARAGLVAGVWSCTDTAVQPAGCATGAVRASALLTTECPLDREFGWTHARRRMGPSLSPAGGNMGIVIFIAVVILIPIALLSMGQSRQPRKGSAKRERD